MVEIKIPVSKPGWIENYINHSPTLELARL
jgi:hypothetical protein